MVGIRFRWRTFFLAWALVYGFFVIPWWLLPKDKPALGGLPVLSRVRSAVNPNILSQNDDQFVLKMAYEGRELWVSEVLAANGTPNLKERLQGPPPDAPIKRIFSASPFEKAHLGGCPDWRCEVTKNEHEADAFIDLFPRNTTGYSVFYSQESPANMHVNDQNGFHMAIGFRHDSPIASPYGYTVKLAKPRDLSEVINNTMITNKSKGATWFVSHCGTVSKREKLVDELKVSLVTDNVIYYEQLAELQKYMEVDIFGACGTKKCGKGAACENAINTDYHFYLALENSVCQDYITEKLWHQGFAYQVVPIVLKRAIVQDYVPPHSVIAFDDYKSVEEMAAHLKELMADKDKYKKYFEWKRDYEVIYLNGLKHDILERPWGICQLCRLLHIKPLPDFKIPDMSTYWTKSCESDGQLFRSLVHDITNNTK